MLCEVPSIEIETLLCGNRIGPRADNILYAAIFSISPANTAGSLPSGNPHSYSTKIAPGQLLIPPEFKALKPTPEYRVVTKPAIVVPVDGTS